MTKLAAIYSQIPKAREFPQGRREGREEKHVRAGDGGAHPGRGRGGVGCRRVRGGELDAGERDLGGARGEPARVEHPLPHCHGHLRDRVPVLRVCVHGEVRGFPIPGSGSPPSRVLVESRERALIRIDANVEPRLAGCVPHARQRGGFFFPPDGRLRGTGGGPGITGEDSWQWWWDAVTGSAECVTVFVFPLPPD